MFHVIQNRGPSANHLLARVSGEEYARLLPFLQPVRLALGDVICDSPNRSSFAYFPTTSVVSLIYSMEDGATAEVALAGNDGVLGISLFLGDERPTNRAIVGIAGEAFRMEARVLKNEFMRGGLFQNVLLRYTGVLIAQISLTAACNRVHTLEKRLCRWLLLTRDRVDSDELVMTQELLAYMLGGRRETVTVAAGRLRDAGLIRHSRGRIVILDRSGLERNACECYRAVHSKCA